MMSRSFYWFALAEGDGLFLKVGLTEMQLTPKPQRAKPTKRPGLRDGSN